MRTNLLLLSLFLFFGSCSDPLEDGSFVGDWFVVGDNNLGYNYWSISPLNIVKPFSPNPEYSYTYEISKDINKSFILTPEFGRDEKLGELKVHKRDTISFASGLKLIRLKTPTKSDLTIDQLRGFLTNSILKYEFNGMTTSLYLSDSLRVASDYLMSASLIRDGYFGRSSLGESWALKSFKGVYVLYHSILHGIEDAAIIIDEASAEELKGTLFIYGMEFPVSVLVNPKISPYKIELLNSILVTNDWETKRTSIYDYSKVFPDVVFEEGEKIIWGISDVEKELTINKNDISKNPFTFEFKKNGKLNFYKFGIPSYQTNWKVTDDGKYVFLYSRWFEAGYFELGSHFDTLKKLTFNFLIYVEQTDSTAIDETLTFEVAGN